jgi:hypothetical protein
VKEIGKRVGGKQHYRYGNQDGDHHDRNMIGHANGGNDAVDREHGIEQENLADRCREAHARPAGKYVRPGLWIHIVMNFLR